MTTATMTKPEPTMSTTEIRHQLLRATVAEDDRKPLWVSIERRMELQKRGEDLCFSISIKPDDRKSYRPFETVEMSYESEQGLLILAGYFTNYDGYRINPRLGLVVLYLYGATRKTERADFSRAVISIPFRMEQEQAPTT